MSFPIASSSYTSVSPSFTSGPGDGGSSDDATLEITVLFLIGGFLISILFVILFIYFIVLGYKAHKYIRNERSHGTERDDPFISWDENVNKAEHERRLREMYAQNLASAKKIASQGKSQQAMVRPEVSPYGDSDSFVDSFSGEENQEGTDAPGHYRGRKQNHVKSSGKATGSRQKSETKSTRQKNEDSHAEESGKVTSNSEHINVARPNKELHKKVKRSSGNPQPNPTKPKAVHQKHPVKRDIPKGTPNSTGAVGTTQCDNADLDPDEEFRKCIENLSSLAND